jgi:hypothetical protein
MTTRTVTVNVTQEHIDMGVRESCTHCPVGRALADAFPEANVFANGATFDIYPWGSDEQIRIDLPGEAEDFIVRFDDDGYGEPFSFTVNVPEG